MNNLNLSDFKIIKISKKNGSFRVIYVPNLKVKKKLKRRLPILLKYIDKYDTRQCIVGFRRNMNCAAAATQHIGYQCTIKMDLSSFFDTVTESHLDYLSKHERDYVKKCLLDGVPRQGLPTSPAVANLAFIPVDNKIYNILRDIVSDCIYTRYADDMIISFNSENNSNQDIIRIAKLIIQNVTSAIHKANFVLNTKKTSIKLASSGNRIITGIAVNDTEIRMSRKTRRKIRAALHQENYNSANGLTEWGSCKVPNTKLITTLLEDTDFVITTNKYEVSKNINVSSLFIRDLKINEIYLYSIKLETCIILNNDRTNMIINTAIGLNTKYSEIILNSALCLDNINAVKKRRNDHS